MKQSRDPIQTDITLIPAKRKIRPTFSLPSRREFFLGAIGFLAARAVPLPGVAPFGLAYLAVQRKFSAESLFTLLWVILGYLSGGGMQSFRYIAACLIFVGVLFFTDRTRDLSSEATFALSLSVLAFFDAFSILWNGFSFSALLILLSDCALTTLGIFVFPRCRSFLFDNAPSRRIPTEEEVLSLWVLVSVILLSFQSLPRSDFFSFANIMGFFLLGMIAVSGGLLSSLIAAPLLGFLLGFQTDLLPCLAVFSFCGLACGLTCRFGKYFTAVALALGGLLLTSYAYGDGIPAVRYIEAPVAAVLLALVPPNLLRHLRRFTSLPLLRAETESPNLFRIRSRLRLAADSFRTLADTFTHLSDKEDQTDMEEIAALFDTTADRVCRHCERMDSCWNHHFNATYKSLFHLLEQLDRHGSLKAIDFGPYLSRHCPHTDQLSQEMTRHYEVYRTNQVWKKKLCENRSLISQQFHGVADILQRMSDDPHTDPIMDNMAAEELAHRLKALCLPAEEIQVLTSSEGHYTIHLTLRKIPIEGPLSLIPVLKATLGRPFSLLSAEDRRFTFAEIPSCHIEAAFATAGKELECGDSHTLHLLRGDKYLATLSDGMGTGHRANRDSSAIVSLLEAFMGAGFDKTIAVKLVNSAMVMRSAKEAFATVDMCMIDLYSGEAEFIKNGAEPSYIKHGYGTETIRAASLPVGMLADIEAETFAYRLQAGDTVIMVSDGLKLREGGDQWLRELLDKIPCDISLNTLADTILERSVALKGGKADDDMTVLVLRFLSGPARAEAS